MTGSDIKRLRSELDCSVGELAETIGVDAKTVLEWESGDRFPTKRHADKLTALRAAGPSGVKRRTRKRSGRQGLDLLADPRLWAIIRKLLAHADLLAEVERAAERYEDPAG
jgi:transcriptional regulator with XRE-family HTH domain